MKAIGTKIVKLLFADIKAPLIALFGLFVFGFLFSIYLVTLNPGIAGLIKGPEILKKEEDVLISEVNQIIDLPRDERPTIATVTDPEKLTGQRFFEKAQEGDKILVYNEAKKAVLYRPSEHRVVELGNLNITQNGGQVAGEAQVPEPQTFTIAIYNGTTTPGLTSVFEDSVLEKYPDAIVSSKVNASRSDYTESIVVNFSGDSERANELASDFNLALVELPGGEVKPADADYLVILGQDRTEP